MSILTIAQAASKLNVTTVRVHGLLKDGKLDQADGAVKVGNKFVKGITEESIEKLLASRKEGRTGNGRQYILTLTTEQVAELTKAGYELKVRFEKKAEA